jgi:hypothetical protein
MLSAPSLATFNWPALKLEVTVAQTTPGARMAIDETSHQQ